MDRRVVVTGLGLLTPIGNSVDQNWNALVNGVSGIGPITRFDASNLPTRIAGEVKGFDPAQFMDAKDARRYDRFVQFALAAAAEAWQDAGLSLSGKDPDRFGVVMGSGIGGVGSIAETTRTLTEHGPRRVSPFFVPGAIINMAPGLLAIRYGLKGPNYGVVSACASAGHAIGDAFHIIKRDEADVMITGGAEAGITDLGVAGFCAARALSTRNDEPSKASRPFDRNRDGFVMGEGAGVLVLEELEHALSRGARIYAELVGVGASADAHHVTAPDPNGDGAARSMARALRSAGVQPEQVGYINAHATSTDAGDLAETVAIKRLFGDHAHRLAVSSTKSMTGHLLGAAAAIETAYTALALYRQVLPPTINLETPGEGCDLDYVPNHARPGQVEVAISNSLGFGGTNTTVVLRRWED